MILFFIFDRKNISSVSIYMRYTVLSIDEKFFGTNQISNRLIKMFTLTLQFDTAGIFLDLLLFLNVHNKIW